MKGNVILGAYELAHGDAVQIGSYTFQISFPSPDAAVTVVVQSTETETIPAGADPRAATPASTPAGSALPAAIAAGPDISTYFTLASSPLTQFRLTICGVLLVLGGMAAVFMLASTDWGKRLQAVWAPGNVSTPHSLFETDCSDCHQGAWQNVAADACKTCHDGPVHQETQLFTPACTTCHTEHRGRQAKLTDVDDRFCIQCHANLRTKDGGTRRDANAIEQFTAGHPEFAIRVQDTPEMAAARVRLNDQANLRDSAQVKLNHQEHLKPLKMHSDGSQKQLECSNCHRMDAQGAYMLPITYEHHCADCHPLDLPLGLDACLPESIRVPHDTPTEVHRFLQRLLAQYCLQNLLLAPPDAEETNRARTRRRPGRPAAPREEAQAIGQCRTEAVQVAEKTLFTGQKQQGCVLCHTFSRAAADGVLPNVRPPSIPRRWLPHSVFNHRAHIHSELDCQDCHDGVRNSQAARDVLLPGIASCQRCHSTSGGAHAGCVTCHVYHPKTAVSSSASAQFGIAREAHER